MASRNSRAWLHLAWIVGLALPGCDPVATVGVYRDAGVRCDPLRDACGERMACTLHPDPSMDACRAVDDVPGGERCGHREACAAGAQCAVLDDHRARLEPIDPDEGTCLPVCARDTPRCPPEQRCIAIQAAGGGIRIDYGLCAPTEE